MAQPTGGLHPLSSPATPVGPRRDCVSSDVRLFAADLLRAESGAVLSLIDRLNASFDTAVSLLVECTRANGSVLVTGLGKSGLIGAKISATLTSLGIASHFVHPAEAAHGDLGRFRKSDVCIALSYSGETDEVVALAQILRQDGLPIISITRGPAESLPPAPNSGTPVSPPSSLERAATAALTIGHVDSMGASATSPAPTSSTTAMLAIGDCLALAASRALNFSDSDFARRHPGGSLGGLLRPVASVLRFRVGQNLEPVPDTATVLQALEIAEQAARRPGAILLVGASGTPKAGLLTGLFTDGDLRRLVRKSTADLAQPISRFMTHNPGTLPESALVRDAVAMVREFRRDEIPVVDAAGRPIGLLDVQDLVAMRLVEDE